MAPDSGVVRLQGLRRGCLVDDGCGWAFEARLDSSGNARRATIHTTQSMPDSNPLRGGELNAAITREVIRVHNESHGRGPKKAFTVHNGNVVVTVLEEVLTPAERKLATNGESDAVLRMRHLYQHSMGPELKQSVEGLTHRQVTAFMSDNHIDPDMAVEIFILDTPLT
jgi:uncharacterized protein YbcI